MPVGRDARTNIDCRVLSELGENDRFLICRMVNAPDVKRPRKMLESDGVIICQRRSNLPRVSRSQLDGLTFSFQASVGVFAQFP